MVDRRLGRGLDFFLSGGRQAQGPAQAPVAKPGDEVVMAEVGTLVPSPFQARKHLDEEELRALAESIRASGILQPILARRVADRLEIVAGERRWRAAQLAGLGRVPVLVRAIADPEAAVFGLVENLQREDLNAIEKARGFQALMSQLGTTQEDLAKRVGLQRSTVTNFLRLLDLPDAVQAHVSRGTLSMGHARTLLPLSDPDLMLKCAEDAIRKGTSVRDLETRVKALLEASKGPNGTPAAASKARPVWLNELEESLVEALGTPVSVRYGRKRSQIIIECAGREEFERVFQRLKNA
ncbi:MAG TPA: ParB/RepB/Spo0J family partition protein [Planctomycetota bacterium]|nr:ParB/RepB/Spo0J family partition protein [Planctomycetota bacterium]